MSNFNSILNVHEVGVWRGRIVSLQLQLPSMNEISIFTNFPYCPLLGFRVYLSYYHISNVLVEAVESRRVHLIDSTFLTFKIVQNVIIVILWYI
jgi:hypothetical protein